MRSFTGRSPEIDGGDTTEGSCELEGMGMAGESCILEGSSVGDGEIMDGDKHVLLLFGKSSSVHFLLLLSSVISTLTTLMRSGD